MTGDSHKPEIIQNAFCRFENDSPEKGIKRSRSATISGFTPYYEV